MSTTKQKIAEATKLLVIHQPFDTISVTAIMKQAHLRRQTFYNFFRDKYDVLAWIYEAEAGAAATKCETFRYWTQTVDQMLTYLAANRTFYQRILKIDTQNAPDAVIKAHFHKMIERIIQDLAASNQLTIDASYQRFLQQVLTGALFETVTAWLTADDPLPLSDETAFICRYLTDGIAGLFDHEQPDNRTPSVRYQVGQVELH